MAKPVGRRGETRERVLATALELFAEQGVSGTSLQMIADRLGVTKAAVYHQFRTKDDIVLEVVRPVMERLLVLLEEAGARPASQERRRFVVHGLIDLVLAHRRLLGVLFGDPYVDALLKSHVETSGHTDRLTVLVVGETPSPTDLVSVAVFGGGLVSVGGDPNLAGLDDGTLRRELRGAAERLLFTEEVARVP
ncbi:TetR/AcrR family transcriptional regulator [Spongisporangium articulatum]|uniref:TetR/AcrR family transcriptional regulator n=1 Tax=Spongisporangium articulatum TaxID=3362603 RepID=A0ABW8AGK0_9ACTN